MHLFLVVSSPITGPGNPAAALAALAARTGRAREPRVACVWSGFCGFFRYRTGFSVNPIPRVTPVRPKCRLWRPAPKRQTGPYEPTPATLVRTLDPHLK